MQSIAALKLNKPRERSLNHNGVLSIAFGVIMLVQPAAGALAVAWMIGWFAIFAGCTYIGIAFRLKQCKRPALIPRSVENC